MYCSPSLRSSVCLGYIFRLPTKLIGNLNISQLWLCCQRDYGYYFIALAHYVFCDGCVDRARAYHGLLPITSTRIYACFFWSARWLCAIPVARPQHLASSRPCRPDFLYHLDNRGMDRLFCYQTITRNERRPGAAFIARHISCCKGKAIRRIKKEDLNNYESFFVFRCYQMITE